MLNLQKIYKTGPAPRPRFTLKISPGKMLPSVDTQPFDLDKSIFEKGERDAFKIIFSTFIITADRK